MSKNSLNKYNLGERTERFGEVIIDFAKKISINDVTKPLIPQLVKAGTSVGANYSEADNAESKKDFHHKIGLCKKESKESMHWLRMIARGVPTLADQARELYKEAQELTMIFGAINRKKVK